MSPTSSRWSANVGQDLELGTAEFGEVANILNECAVDATRMFIKKEGKAAIITPADEDAGVCWCSGQSVLRPIKLLGALCPSHAHV